MIEYSNFAVRFEGATEDELRVSVESFAGGESEEGRTTPEAIHLVDLLNFGGRGSWRDLVLRSTPKSPGLEVRNLGKDLFNTIFQGRALRNFDRSIGALEKLREPESSAPGLRLQLYYDPRQAAGSVIDELPWELLCDPLLDEGFFCLDPRTPVVRSLRMPQTGGLMGYSPPLRRILVAIAAPNSFPQLDVEAERRRIEHAWRFEYSLEVEVLVNASLERVQQQLRALEYQIFHFIGHGEHDLRSSESHLIFEGRSGEAERVSGRRLAALLRGKWQLPRLVFLNACHSSRTGGGGTNPASGVALELLNAGVPAVLGMKSPVTDLSAVQFSGETYRLLAEGAAIEEAVTYARHALRQDSECWDWAIPALYVQSQPCRLFSLASTKHRKVHPARLEVLAGPIQVLHADTPTGENQPKILKSLQRDLFKLIDDLRLELEDLDRLPNRERHEIEHHIIQRLAGLGAPANTLLNLDHVNLRFKAKALLNRPELGGRLHELHRKSAVFSSHSVVEIKTLTLENSSQLTEVNESGLDRESLRLLLSNRALIQEGRMSIVPNTVLQKGPGGFQAIFKVENLESIEVLQDKWSANLLSQPTAIFRPDCAFTVSSKKVRLLPLEAVLEVEQEFAPEFAEFHRRFREMLEKMRQDDDATTLQNALAKVERQIGALDAIYEKNKNAPTNEIGGNETLTVLCEAGKSSDRITDALKRCGQHFAFFPSIAELPDQIRESPFFVPWVIHRAENEAALP